MPSLRELQCGFMRAVLDGPAADAAIPVQFGEVAAAHGLDVYASTARENFSNALQLSYPVIRRLVGAAYFEQCARGYQRERPSRSGDLQPAGALFPAYLDALHRAGDYRYLGEVARFEWQVQEAWLAADHAPLDLRKLAAAAPADYERLQFHTHPSLRLFESDYPCVAIWQANSAAEDPPVIDLNGAPRERVAILHCGGELQFHRLSAGEHAFLAASQSRAPFAAAVDSAEIHSAFADDFNASEALRRFVLAAAIVDFTTA